MNCSLPSIPSGETASFATNGHANPVSEAARETPARPERDLEGASEAAPASPLNPSLSQGLFPVISAPAAQPLRILMVDDEPLVREVVRLFLEEDRHSITMAVNGRDGLARFCDGEFDLVVTDRFMPEMNGTQLARAIKKLKPSQPIILLTGCSGGAVENSAADLVVPKPFTIDSLRRAIRQVLQEG